MSDKTLLPYGKIPRNMPDKSIILRSPHDIATVPKGADLAVLNDKVEQIPKTIPGNALQSTRILLGLIKDVEKPTEIKQSKAEFMASPKFLNMKGSTTRNFRVLEGLFDDEGLTSQLLFATRAAFSPSEIIEIESLKNIESSDKVRLSVFVKATITKGEKDPNFRKDPSMRALLRQISDKINNVTVGQNTSIEQSDEISIKDHINDFDIDKYDIKLLKAMEFVLKRFISIPNANNSSSTNITKN
jgi:hypothetical protein